MAAAYLVLFVADAADDGHADALREMVRQVPGAGFFDDPADTGARTVTSRTGAGWTPTTAPVPEP